LRTIIWFAGKSFNKTTMQKLRVDNFSISIDGFGAGPGQGLDNPLGKNGMDLHRWFFPTDAFQQMISGQPGEKGIDNDFASRGLEKAGACIMGRNMFGPIRGGWPDDKWRGWWGENPPFHCPVFVLTNHGRESVAMEGGTVFHFVTDGINAALHRAKDAANGMDIRVGGGVNTIRQYLQEALIDEMHIAIAPIILGKGERLFDGIDLPGLGYKCVQTAHSSKAMHTIIAKNL
jgi:dihydrofolate reductase